MPYGMHVLVDPQKVLRSYLLLDVQIKKIKLLQSYHMVHLEACRQSEASPGRVQKLYQDVSRSFTWRHAGSQKLHQDVSRSFTRTCLEALPGCVQKLHLEACRSFTWGMQAVRSFTRTCLETHQKHLVTTKKAFTS